jgi:predicted dehydrogenase
VANSSVESAQRSILHYKLPASTKAYGSAQEIANDPNVDLVVVAVNVKSHFALAKPAIDSGKNVFVEWPLGATVAEAEELTKLADAKGVKTSVGLQTRFDPAVQKIREIISSGKIGKVVSSSALICSTLTSVDMWPKGIEYFLDIKSGGNEFTIVFGHCKHTVLFSSHSLSR